ncbi:MAG: TrkH family potassium uptake protein [Planctomycetes bacterium]|nr:TrkH family potassium uptake protein [Planctomycetota bacterium]
MNLAQVARLLAGFAALLTLAQVVPLVFALAEPATERLAPVAGFVGSMVIGTIVATLLWLAGRRSNGETFRKEAIAVAGLSWFLAGLLGALPFVWSGLLPNPVDAVFEATSGLTTCGATMLGSGSNAAIADVPRSLLLWRALTQWIGGIGIVLVFVALLPAMGVTGKNLLSSESVAVGTDSFQVRAIERARLVAVIYALLTALCTVLLVAIGGYGWFDAVCQAFAALATGGYSTRASIAEFDSLGGEIVLTVFMFLAGASFAMIATHWRSGWRCAVALARSGEFRMYALVTAAVVGSVTFTLVSRGLPFGTALRQASFNGVSILTSTGFATADFQVWPPLATLVLFCAMFVGGCTGSTAGGIKQVRLLVTLKLVAYTIRHFVRPKSVERLKLDDEVLPASTISTILCVVLLWLVCVVLSALVISLDDRLNFVAALTTSASMQGSCGPALTLVDPFAAADVLLHGGTAPTLAATANVGPFGGFGELASWTKAVLVFQMVLGRLELLTVLALFAPSLWRR